MVVLTRYHFPFGLREPLLSVLSRILEHESGVRASRHESLAPMLGAEETLEQVYGAGWRIYATLCNNAVRTSDRS